VPGSLVAVEVSLTLRYVIGVGGRNLKHIAAAVVINILRRGDGRFKTVFIPHSAKAAKGSDLLFLNGINDLAREEFGFEIPLHLASRRNNSPCSTEVLRMSFFAFSNDIMRTFAGSGGTFRVVSLDSATAMSSFGFLTIALFCDYSEESTNFETATPGASATRLFVRRRAPWPAAPTLLC
jgi:hypothetical protein